jgi:serine/threonine-protein kinase RsbW
MNADLDDVRTSDVVLQVPPSAGSLRVVRMVASTLVADDGFDVDEVDDVRMAVDELCAAVVESEPASPMHVRFRLEDHRLEVRIEADSSSGDGLPIDELREAVLGAVADRYTTEVVDGQSVASFTKMSARATVEAPSTHD